MGIPGDIAHGPGRAEHPLGLGVSDSGVLCTAPTAVRPLSPSPPYSLHAHFVMYALVPALSIGVIHLTRGHSLDSGPGAPNWGDPSR